MFKNACYFRISDGFELPTLPALEKALQKSRFVPCGPTQAEASGWVPPRGGKHTQLAELVGGQLILKLCTEKRAVPSSAVKAGVEEKVERYKKETGLERVGAKAKKAFKEEVLLDLLPRAFTKRAHTLLWLAPAQRLLVIDSGTLAGADRIVSALLAALIEIPGGGVPLDLQLIQTELSPAAAMSQWLRTREAPYHFTIDRDCELKTPDDQKSSVRYTRHTLDIDEVAQHIAAGKVPTQLAMTWNDRVSFVLTETGQVRRIKLLDVVMEGVDKPGKDEDGFDADAAILTGEMAGLLEDLLGALGSDSAPAAGG